jgi:tetrapyrrole methylase family protein / MazG family protein
VSTLDELLRELESGHGIRVEDGLQLLGPEALLTRPFDPGMPVLLLPAESPAPHAGSPAVLPGRQARGSDAVGMLRALYPPDHALIGLAGTADATVGSLTDRQLHDGPRLVPALEAEHNLASPHALPWLVARLRAPDGCPWDREQDHLSLRKFLLEEAYEVYDALEHGSTPALAEELGDVLLQIVLHAHYGAEAGVFDLADVYRAVMSKIIRRHPHVFGDVVAESADEVLRNWEQIKAGERAEASAGETLKSHDAAMPAAFAGLSRSLPALAYAQEMQERAASLGYDWPDDEGVLDKIAEEAREVVAAADQGERREEFGDLLLVVVNLARRLGIDAEAALRAASSKFAARFAHVERAAAERDVELRSLSMAELDDLWQQAKSGRTA